MAYGRVERPGDAAGDGWPSGRRRSSRKRMALAGPGVRIPRHPQMAPAYVRCDPVSGPTRWACRYRRFTTRMAPVAQRVEQRSVVFALLWRDGCRCESGLGPLVRLFPGTHCGSFLDIHAGRTAGPFTARMIGSVHVVVRRRFSGGGSIPLCSQWGGSAAPESRWSTMLGPRGKGSMAEPLVFDSLVYQVRKRACGRERPSARMIPFSADPPSPRERSPGPTCRPLLLSGGRRDQ